MDRPGVRHVPEGSGDQGKMEETGSEIIRGAPTTLAVKGQTMMMMMNDTETRKAERLREQAGEDEEYRRDLLWPIHANVPH